MMTLRSQFDTELQLLATNLIKMGAMATEAIGLAMEALRLRDLALAQSVIAADDQINEMERSIEQQCLRLLLRQQPVAGDLRKISAAIKMITDMERIGDGAADIAEISLHIAGSGLEPVERRISQMAECARHMVSASIDAYVREDLALASETIAADDKVDAAFDEIKGLLAREMVRQPDHMDLAIDYLMIIKYVERLGDHAVNICQWVEFMLTGVHKREKIL